RSHVSRVLYSCQHHQQRRTRSCRRCQQIRDLHFARFHQRCHSLRMFRVRNPLKQSIRRFQNWEGHLPSPNQRRQSLAMPLSTFAEQHRLHATPARQRFLYQTHTFHSHVPFLCRQSAAQRHPKLFQPPVVPATDHVATFRRFLSSFHPR